MDLPRYVDRAKARYETDGIWVLSKHILRFIYRKALIGILVDGIGSGRGEMLLDSAELKARCSATQLWELDDEVDDLSTEDIHEIIPMKGDDSLSFQNKPFFLFKSPFVAEVETVTIIGPRHVAITDDGTFIADVIHFDPYSQAFDNSKMVHTNTAIFYSPYHVGSALLRGSTIPATASLPVAATLYWASNNYYHWVLEEILKLRGVARYREVTGNEVTLILPPDAPSFVYEFLELLEFDTYVEWGSEPLRVERLVVPSFPEPTPKALEWLRETVFDAIEMDESGPDWVYISRQNSKGRKVANFDDVREVLDEYEVEIVLCENLSLSEEVNIFNSAKGVIGPHGAGLTATVWGNDLTVIEIFNNVINAPFYILADILGHDYHAVVGKAVGQTEEKNRDIVVDIREFERLLDSVMDRPDQPCA